MNKALSFLLCYAVGMVAFALDAKGAVSQNDFSNESAWGLVPRFGLSDDGRFGTSEKSYWFYGGEYGNASVITNYEPGASRYSAFAPSNPQPDYMKSGGENAGLVDVRALVPLQRTFKPVKATGSSSIVTVPSEGDGLFVDQLVRFFPREQGVAEVPDVDLDGSKAKFMCWLSAPEGGAQTNFVVTAGRYGSNGLPYRVNYVTTARVVPGRWYRLTVRLQHDSATVAKVSEPCFGLYLDGELVCCGEGYAIGDDAAEMTARFAGNELYSRRALFPPLRRFEKVGLYGLAVQGRGHLDELGVVTDRNPVAHAANDLVVAVAMDPQKVTNVTCSVTAAGGTAPSFTTNASYVAEVLLTVSPGDSVHVDCLTAEGFAAAAALSLQGNVGAVASASGYDFAMTDEGAFESADRLVARIDAGGAYFDVGGVVYESIDEALEAANASETKRLRLANNVTLSPKADNGQMRILPTYEVVLDLCGRRLKGEHFQDEATIYSQGRLTVVDSVGGGVIEAPGASSLIEVEVSTNDAVDVNHRYAFVQLGSELEPNDFAVKGRVRCIQGALEIRGGSYLTPADLEPTNGFYLAEYVAAERYAVEGPVAVAGEGNYWSVVYDGRLHVVFEAAHGAIALAETNVVAGARLERPQVEAPGYTVTNWVVKATGASWDFAVDTVVSDMTLVAAERLDEFAISYDIEVPQSAPTSYTVAMLKTELPQGILRPYLTFVGWRDARTGLMVAEVGRTATFVGTETPVTGDLDLKAVWAADVLTWSNAELHAAESNGVYAGAWSLTLPVSDRLPEGTPVALDEIAFAIVNPHLYPKTAEHLAVRPEGGETVVSAVRTYGFDEATQEYPVSADDRLANGRAKVVYRFTGLTVRSGAKNRVWFATAAGDQAAGFLRLKLSLGPGDAVFGNCEIPGGTQIPPCEAYLNYCPVYEIKAHAAEGGAGE